MRVPSAPAQPSLDFDDVVVDDRHPMAPGLEPVSVRATLRADSTPMAPRVAGPALFSSPGPRREGGQPMTVAGAAGSLGSFVRSRETALAAAAVAVVGAVSGAAALLPAGGSGAEAASGPITSPVPLPSGTSSTDGQVCFSRTEIIRAMRHHHRRTIVHPVPRSSTVAAAGAPASTHAPHAIKPTRRPRASAGSRASGTSDPVSAASAAVVTTGTDLRGIISGATRGSLLGLNAGTYILRDFDSQLMGANLGTGGIKGAGMDKTIIAMATKSSTKAGSVPTKDYSTNQLYLLSTIGGTPGLSGFTLRGTDQGHLYNGLRVGQAKNARINDVAVESVPGDASHPPGETFLINDWRTDGSVWSGIRVDGKGIGAAGFGVNSSTNLTVKDSTFTGVAASSGGAFWQSKNITLDDVKIVDNRSGLNFERDSGTITLNRPTFKNNRFYDIQMGTDWEGGNVIINDPVLASGQKIRMNVPSNYQGHVNGQKRSNIHVYVDGVDRTSELVQFL